MAHVLRRWGALLQRGLQALTAPAADPRRTFVTAAQQQQELLAQVRRAGQDLASARAALAGHRTAAEQRLPALEQQARRAVAAGQEEVARLLLQRRQAIVVELRLLADHERQVEAEGQRLALAEGRLTAQLAAFQTQQDIIAARYSAAEAQVRLSEVLAGLSGELSDLAQVLEQAEERTGMMQARAAAIEQLFAAGVLEMPGQPADGLLARYLTIGPPVAEQLAALEAEAGGRPSDLSP